MGKVIVTCECTCWKDGQNADGSFPMFLTDETKAVYWWRKLRARARDGARRVNNELVVDPPHVRSTNGWEVRSRLEPLKELSDYSLYLGVHLDGRHILTVK